LKVALVSPGWPSSTFANGIATYADLLREGFRHIGVETRILAAHTGESALEPDIVALDRMLAREGILARCREYARARLFPSDTQRVRYGHAVAIAVKSLQPHFRPDVVEMEETTGAFDVVRAQVDVPVVVRLHGPYFLNAAALDMPKDAYYRNRVARERKAIFRARGITSPSADTLNRVRREYGLELSHAEVIPNPAPIVPRDQQWQPQGADRDLILFVGRFDKHKGGDIVIEAFVKVAATRPTVRLAFIGPDWRLHSGGSGSISISEFLADRVRDPAIRARIDYLGGKPAMEILPWRLRAGMTIVASRYENFPMTVVEAIAHGCPLVAARVGGIPEIVANEKNGLLFEAGDADDLARSMTIMLDNPDRAAEWARQGVRDAQSRFASHVIARQTADYYRRFLDSLA